jgi:diguanylate cyclase (GGDEF)-like protein
LFTVVAALLPSVTTAWIAYRQARKAIVEQTTQELQTASEQAVREMELWLKERLHELRTFTGSYEITENVERAGRDQSAANRVRVYLSSLQSRFPEHARLFLLDARGQAVAYTGDSLPRVPEGALGAVRNTGQLVGEPTWDSASAEPRVTLMVPVQLGSGRFVGALGVDTRIKLVVTALWKYAPEGGRAYLTTYDRRVILASDSVSADLLQNALPPATASPLFDGEGRAVEYTGLAAEPVLGVLRRIPSLTWAFVAEIPIVRAYAEVRMLRNTAFLILVGLVLGISLIAYRLGLLIVRPLDRLARGAMDVAGGNFAVDLPPAGGGEVGLLTAVFNDMVAKLREGRARLDKANEILRQQNEQLEKLSITDGLTGLFNRRRLMEMLTGEVERSKRLGHVCTVLMMDVDNFKRYNDAHGHQAGDAVLKGLGDVLRETTREIDCTARYGGEEFFVLLPETDIKDAADVAERIRTRLKERIFLGGRVTVSVGIAAFPEHGDTPEDLIAAADAALYRAKREGRDRVLQAAGR